MIKAAARLLMPGSSMGYTLPDENWFNYARDVARYTPDIAVLEQHAWQLYFACDETQIGHLKNDLLGDFEYKMPGFTQQSFNYWAHEAPFNAAVPMEAEGFHNPMPNYPDIAKIKGQILMIRPQAFLNLDNYKENGVQYLRKKVRIIVPYRALKKISDHPDLPTVDIEWVRDGIGLTFERVCTIRAWMYVGVPKYWDKMISAYDYTSVQTYNSKNRPWCKTYYQLRRPEK